MIGLLDTAVVVDLLRGHPPAIAWLGQQQQLGVTRIVWLEIIEGAPTAAHQQAAVSMLRRFLPVELTPSDWIWATEQLSRYRLSLGTDAFDCLIAAASYRLQIPLFTQNLKHFVPLIGNLALKPY